jgi:hypothetical protein
MKLFTCTAHWENIITAPPFTKATWAFVLNFIAGKIYYGNARGAKHSSLDASGDGIKRLVC